MSVILWVILYTILLLLLSIPVLHLLSRLLALPILSFIARLIATFIAFNTSSSFGVLSGIILRLIGQAGLTQYAVARSFKYTMLLLANVSFVVSDPHSSLSIRPAILVGNHQTELDVLMLGCVFPPYCSVTSKASLKYWPLLGQYMLLSKTVFINRSQSNQARAAFTEAVKMVKGERQSTWIFPEGTRSYTDKPDMLEFKKGAFHLAVQAQVPIVPVVVANYANVLDAKRRIFRAGRVPVSVLEPVSTVGLSANDVGELTARVRGLMQDELVRVTAAAQRTGVAVPGRQAIGVEQALKED